MLAKYLTKKKDIDFVKDLIKIMNKIVELGYKSKKRKNVMLKDSEKISKEFTKLMERRFGIRAKLDLKRGNTIATIPPVTALDSVVSEYNYKKAIQDHAAISGTNDPIVKMYERNNEILREFGKIEIDMDSLFIHTDEPLESFVLIDPVFVVENGITPTELAATVLHEIGHDFEYIRYQAYLSVQYVRISDKIKEVIDGKKGVIELILELENTKDIEVSELTFSDKVELIMRLPDKLLEDFSEEYRKKYILPSKVISRIKEFEIRADDFACRFGLEKELATGLQKLFTVRNVLDTLTASFSAVGTPVRFLYRKFIGIRSIFDIYVIYLLETFVLHSLTAFLSEVINSELGEDERRFALKASRVLTFLLFTFKIYDNASMLIQIKRLFGNQAFFKLTAYGLAYSLITVFISYNAVYSKDDESTLWYMVMGDSTIYENPVKRLENIKRSIISKLKTIDDKEIQKEMLDELYEIERIILDSKQELNKLFISILDIVLPSYTFKEKSEMNPMYILEMLNRKHINNDLYVKSVEISLIPNDASDK